MDFKFVSFDIDAEDKDPKRSTIPFATTET